MRKFVILGLSFILVLSSVALVFADGGGPVILPESDIEGTGLQIEFSDGVTRVFRSLVSPVYLVYYNDGSNYRCLVFSDINNAVVVQGRSGGPYYEWHCLDSYNGYYYSQSVTTTPVSESYTLDGTFDSPSDVIDYINSSVFSSTFDVTYVVDGGISWLSSMAQAVVSNGLLLFFVLIIFVGVGVGLFRRFI